MAQLLAHRISIHAVDTLESLVLPPIVSLPSLSASLSQVSPDRPQIGSRNVVLNKVFVFWLC